MRRGLGDVHDRHVEQLLQPFPPVLAEARLHDRVVRVGVAGDGVHHGDGGEVALEVALHRVGPDVGGERQDLGLRACHRFRRGRDGLGHRGRGVDVHDEDAHCVRMRHAEPEGRRPRVVRHHRRPRPQARAPGVVPAGRARRADRAADRGGAHRPRHDGLRKHVADCVRTAFDRRRTTPCSPAWWSARRWWRATTPIRRCSRGSPRPQPVGPDAFAVHYLAVPPSLFGTVADGIAAAGLAPRSRLIVEKPFGHDLASARGAERTDLEELPRGPGVPGRPLPRQGAGRGPARAALRQHAARAAVEPGVDRPLRDHDGRGLRRRRPRLVLRRRRHRARRRAEPPAAGARLPAHGAADVGGGRRPARREAPTAVRDAGDRAGRGRARPLRRVHRDARA